MYKAIFWDNDGVLVDTEPLYFESTKQALAEVGVDFTMDFFINQHLRFSTSTFQLAIDKGFSEEQIEKIRDRRMGIYIEMLKTRLKPIDGVSEVLETLHGKIKMGVVSSSLRVSLDIILKSTGFAKFFDFTISGDEVKHAKPNPEPYLKALEKSGFMAEECLVIEDTERGVTAAKDAGLTCFVIPNGLSKTNDFSRADRVLGNVRELMDFISGAGRQN